MLCGHVASGLIAELVSHIPLPIRLPSKPGGARKLRNGRSGVTERSGGTLRRTAAGS
jgi:hypothetical protein